MRYINRSLEDTRHVQFWKISHTHTKHMHSIIEDIWRGREDDNFNKQKMQIENACIIETELF